MAMHGKFDAIFFDMDGTIIDSYWFHTQYLRLLLRRFNINPSEKDVARVMGISLQYILEQFLPPELHSVAHADAKLLSATEEAQDLIRSVKMIPGAVDVLKTLRGAGFILLLVTNSPNNLTKQIAHILNFVSLFDGIYPADDTETMKTNRCLQLFDKYNLTPQRVLYVGDSMYDMDLASTLAMQGCLIDNEYSWLRKVSKSGSIRLRPTYTIHDIREIPLLIG